MRWSASIQAASQGTSRGSSCPRRAARAVVRLAGSLIEMEATAAKIRLDEKDAGWFQSSPEGR